jgi:hypothetical protein
MQDEAKRWRTMEREGNKVSWHKTGFEYQRRDNATYLSVNEGKIRQSDGFQEDWASIITAEALNREAITEMGVNK